MLSREEGIGRGEGFAIIRQSPCPQWLIHVRSMQWEASAGGFNSSSNGTVEWSGGGLNCGGGCGCWMGHFVSLC